MKMRRNCRGLLLAGLMLILSGMAEAAPVDFNLPSESLATSLKAVATAGGLSLAVNNALLVGKTAPALKGTMEPADALHRLLAGSGLTAVVTAKSVVVTQTSEEINLAPVKVVEPEYAGGPNGSTDPTATENTGSYAGEMADIGSKFPLPVKDTPQAISVLTQQRIQDQDLYNIFQALEEMPGIQVWNNTDNQYPQITLRGYNIDNYQFDGGAIGGIIAFNISEYDHLEVLRGADGMFAGAGNPSGVVNLVRKRPLDHFQVIGEFDGGSWHDFREIGDITGPLALDGALRGRLVVENHDQHFFYDTANTHNTSVYGTVEADLTPTTMLTIGGSYGWYRAVPWMYGLPRLDNGENVGYSRSQCICYPWDGNEAKNLESFFRLDQRINDQWKASVNFTYLFQKNNWEQSNYYNLGDQLYVGAAIDQSTNHQYLLDANIEGKFELFGQPQQFSFGADFTPTEGSAQYPNTNNSNPLTGYQYLSIQSLYPIDNNSVYAPQRVAGFGTNVRSYTTQWAFYSQARVQPVDFVHLWGGFRFSGYDQNSYYSNGDFNLAHSSNSFESGIITPYAGITIDLTKDLAAYFSYTNIFQPQPNNLTAPPVGVITNSDGSLTGLGAGPSLPPVVGDTMEVGLKGDLNNKKLQLTAALYRTHQINGAYGDPDYPQTIGIGQFASCCYLAEADNVDEGLDLEVTGQILPGWQVAGSFTYDYQAVDYGPSKSSPLSTLYPKRQWKLWTTYRLPGELNAFTIGGGFNGQSSYYNEGTVATVYNFTSKDFDCPCVDYRFKAPSWTIFSMRGSWQVTENVLAAVDLKNMFDRTYFQSTASPYNSNWYGEPRSFMFSLRVKY